MPTPVLTEPTAYPGTCCPGLWWCTPSGPVQVFPDNDGRYTRPTNATGHPYRTQAEAAAVCPVPPVTRECGGFTFVFPGEVTLSLVNQTGCMPAASDKSSVVVFFTCATGYGSATQFDPAFVLPTGCSGYFTGLPVLWSLITSAQSVGMVFTGNTTQELSFVTSPNTGFSAGYKWKFTGANSFSNDTPPAAFAEVKTSRVVTGVDARFSSPTLIGLLEILNPSNVTVGSADVYLQ